MNSEQQAKRRDRRPMVTGLIVVIVIIVAAVLAYFAWRTIEAAPTPIGDILGDLRTYDGQLVTVRGKVSNPLNVMLMKAYDVEDDSGTIKIVTERGLPKVGDLVTVQGQVRELFNFNGVNMTVIYELAEEDQP